MKFGIRVDDRSFSKQSLFPCSRRWYQGEPEETMLSGTSSIEIQKEELNNIEQAYQKVSNYDGNMIYFLSSDEIYPGDDPGEIVMVEPKIIGKYEIIWDSDGFGITKIIKK